MKPPVHRLLQKLEETSGKYWNITPGVGLFIYQLILTQKYAKVLEIGTSNGYSAIWIASALEELKKLNQKNQKFKKSPANKHYQLYTIESHFKERFHLAAENIKKSSLSNYITQIAGHAPEAIPKTPRFFDLAFFDATKCEHIDYFHVLQNRITKGGCILTDNILSHSTELAPYISLLKKHPAYSSYSLHLGQGLLISVKRECAPKTHKQT